jgi:Protein of unknown function (DUF2806)
MSWLPEHLPGERLAIKIWQTVTERGISGLLSPWQIKRVGRAHADVRRLEIQTLAQAYRDGTDILAGRKTLDESGRLVERKPTGDPSVVPAGEGQLTILPNQTVPLLEGLRQEQSCRELERAINLRTTIAMAEGEASSIADENVSDEPVNPDWFARWRANAEEVHDDEMRRLWARILAGEAEKPGRFSLHTLDFMRRLSKEDAALIEKVAPFVAERNLIYDDSHLDQLLARRGLNFGVYLELQDLGVMSGVEGLSLTRTWAVRPPTRTNLRFWTRALSVSSQESKTLELSIYVITKVGAQVMSLGNFRADNEYVHAVGQLIVEKGFEVDLGDVAEVRDGRFQIAGAQPVGRRVHLKQ